MWGEGGRSQFVKPVGNRIGSAFVGNLFSLCSNFYISAGKGLIKKLTEQIVYLAFYVYTCLILYSINVLYCRYMKTSTISTFHRTLSD